MTDIVPTPPKPVWSRSRKGKPNRNSMTVKLALKNMNFDAVQEWVLAFRELDDPNQKLERLEKLMKFVFPTIKETDTQSQEVIEMELEQAQNSTLELLKEPEEMDTDILLKALDDGSTKDKA